VSTPADMRGFLRDLLLKPEGRAIVSLCIKKEKVLIKALELASSDAKTDGDTMPVSVDVRILAAITAMPIEVQRVYAETGKLPERYWEQPWARKE